MKVEVISLNVSGIETQYTEPIWVEDTYGPHGGYYSRIKRTHETPKIIIDFLAKIDINLDVGAIYTDGINSFLAISRNRIRNVSNCVDKFEIPKKLTLISHPYSS
mgnify:CR=1 FL=1